MADSIEHLMPPELRLLTTLPSPRQAQTPPGTYCRSIARSRQSPYRTRHCTRHDQTIWIAPGRGRRWRHLSERGKDSLTQWTPNEKRKLQTKIATIARNLQTPIIQRWPCGWIIADRRLGGEGTAPVSVKLTKAKQSPRAAHGKNLWVSEIWRRSRRRASILACFMLASQRQTSVTQARMLVLRIRRSPAKSRNPIRRQPSRPCAAFTSKNRRSSDSGRSWPVAALSKRESERSCSVS